MIATATAKSTATIVTWTWMTSQGSWLRYWYSPTPI